MRFLTKLNSQSRVDLPMEIRRLLGGPGSVVNWEVRGNKVVVSRAVAEPPSSPSRAPVASGEVRPIQGKRRPRKTGA